MSAGIPENAASRSTSFRQISDAFLAHDGLPFSEVLTAEKIQNVFGRIDGLFGMNGAYSTVIVVWAFLSRVLKDGKQASCQSAAARIVSHCLAVGVEPLLNDTGDDCKARAKVSLKALHELSNEVAADLEQRANETWSWKNRHAKLIDGFTFTMPATPKNEAEFPHPRSQRKGDADSNLYKWSLDFDTTGHKLTSVMLGRSGGTGGGGNSSVFDATPVAENADAELIATTMLADLLNQSPLPADNMAAIDARRGLKPLVRKMSLEQIKQQGLNADRIAEQCRKVLVNRYGNPLEFQRALRWAEALRPLEPVSLRTRVLLGAANVRCGHFEKAIEIFQDRPDDLKKATTMKEWQNHVERSTLLLVATVESGAPARVYGPVFLSISTQLASTKIRRPAGLASFRRRRGI